MKISEERQFRGTVLWVSPDLVMAARGPTIWRSGDDGVTWEPVARLPLDSASRGWALHPWLRRLSRREVHHVIRLDPETFLICGFRRFYRLQLNRGAIEALPTPWHGGRPLALAESGGTVYYGEYTGNPDRRPISVWGSSNGGEEWAEAWTFDDVRHVHGVYADPHDGSMWVTTGDLDEECGLWRTDDGFSTLQKVAGGDQSKRVVQPLFTEKSVLFGSDAPTQRNQLYCLDRESGLITAQQEVGGPVFYGCQVGAVSFFSTAVEPSEVNKTPEAEVWGSDDDGVSWEKLLMFRKDPLPMKLFQYGQVLFPSSQSRSARLWLTPFATYNHQTSLGYKLHANQSE